MLRKAKAPRSKRVSYIQRPLLDEKPLCNLVEKAHNFSIAKCSLGIHSSNIWKCLDKGLGKYS
jgi:hypothetical protein